jgi:hypothetical protein
MTPNQKDLISMCIHTADDRRSWTLQWIFSDGSAEEAEFPATAEGAEELLDTVREFTAGRVKR